MSLLRLNLCDSVTGICFFEKTWKWSGTSIAEGICKLVLTFHKLSNEVGDTGEVKGVLFEAPTANQTFNPASSFSSSSSSNSNSINSSSNSSISSSSSSGGGGSNSTSPTGSISSTTSSNIRHSFHSRTPSTTGSSSTAKRIKQVVTAPPIRLSCEKDEKYKITVSVFYEKPNVEDQVKLFLLNVLQEFSHLYGASLPDLRPILNEMSEFPEKCTTKPEEILLKFKDFEKIADNIKIQSKLD
ncbi:hypothetical protein CYY_006516 [Polysphondylium violaceum]|uniref:Uncharacterized protein n=1 Tax=Polysphondylium violaceum TaxID=133409 RepID=A0A8J4PR89_9MYCE|nr:hypothetical protein CYY_006516 [Polysphondylium violaceum]